MSTAGSTTTPLPITGVDPRVQHAARHELELEHLAVDDERVARVVAALVADAHRRFLGEIVGERGPCPRRPTGCRRSPRRARGLLVTLRDQRDSGSRWGNGTRRRFSRAAREARTPPAGADPRHVRIRCVTRCSAFRTRTAARFAAPDTSAVRQQPRRYDAFGPAAPQPLDSPLDELVPGMRVDAASTSTRASR